MLYPDQLGGRLGRMLLDALVLLWTAAWALAGWEVFRLVMALEVVADGITATGRTFNRWVAAFRAATPHNVPWLTSALADLANRLQRSAGDPLVRSGVEAHLRIEQLAIALALVTALAPILIVALTYLRWRWRDVRERSAAVAFLVAAQRGGRLEQAKAVLAYRAVATLPYRRLMKASRDPVGDLAGHDYDALAGAMLRRAGISPPPAVRAAPRRRIEPG